MLSGFEAFIKYFHGQRRRTQWVIDAAPAEKADWRPWAGEPSPAEILCRLGATHLMYATVVAHDYWIVDDFEQATGSWRGAQAYLQARTEEALDLLRPLPDRMLDAKRQKLNTNLPMAAWRFLMAMIDAEIQHRTLLSTYLMLLDARRPQMDAMSIDVVRATLDAK
jgi:uncharacterized damage-inducible protein DinB